MKAKAVAYLRVSGKGQVDGDGFDRQGQAIREWAEREGVEIVATYREPGISGDLASRPALARMLVDLERNHVDVGLVVVEKADRLARDLYVQEGIIRDVAKMGREVASAVEGELVGDPTRDLIRQIMGAVAQYEKAMIVQKMAAARARIRARGERCEGRKPFGETPSEQQALDRIRELRRQRNGRRLGFQRIANKLNEEGIPTRSGKPWAPAVVRRIVRREMPGMA